MLGLRRSQCAVVLAAHVIASTASATVFIDRFFGRSGFFSFVGGVVIDIDGVEGNDLEITVPENVSIDFVRLEDRNIPGDEFALKLDGVTLVPDDSNPGDFDLFFADYFDIPLTAGTHTFEIVQTADCCGSGDASYEFSSPREAGSAGVTFDWVVVGGPGNAAHSSGFGAVANTYRISKFEVTNIQYAEFLNAVADTDTNALYNSGMGSGFGGITRSGIPGGFTYDAIAGRGNMPVNFVSYWDALRFVNWLHNGQPVGVQGNATTEDGAYTITPIEIAQDRVERNPGAKIFVTNEDEWIKAGYYHVASAGYFRYPAGTDTQTVCAAPSVAANTANCDNAVGDLTNVGSYTGSASPNGTFDQGGNVWEWVEQTLTVYRDGFGGGFPSSVSWLRAGNRSHALPEVESPHVGFRVASPVPSPVPSLSPLGVAFLGSLIGLAGWRRLRR